MPIDFLSTLLIPALVNYGTDYSAQQFRRKLGNPSEVLKNHDLTTLVGRAVGLVVEAYADEVKVENAKSAKVIHRVAGHVPAAWPEIVGRLDLDFKSLDEARLVTLMAETRQQPPASGVTRSDWMGLLELLDPKEQIKSLGQVAEENLLLRLDQQTPIAIRELLKHDAEHGGKAFAGLIIDAFVGVNQQLLQIEAANTSGVESILAMIEKLKTSVADYRKELSAAADQKILNRLAGLGEQFSQSQQSVMLKLDGLISQVGDVQRLLRKQSEAELPARLLKLERRPNPSPKFPEVTGYTVRKTLFNEIAKQLKQSDGDVGLTQAMATGDGGYGKSVLAMGYAAKHVADYPGGVFLIYCDRGPAPTLLAELGESLFVNPPVQADLTPEAYAALVSRTLEDGKPALLVCDNVKDRQHWAELEPWLPGKACRRLITSRTRALPNVRSIPVGHLNKTEARSILKQYCKTAGHKKNAAAVDRILSYVDYLAVAVAAVGARMHLLAQPRWDDYADDLAKRGFAELFDDAGKLKNFTGYDQLIGTVLDDAVNALDDANPGACRALEYAALMPDQIVPRPWLVRLLVSDPQGFEDDSAAEDLIDHLVGGLLQASGLAEAADKDRIFRLHRLHRQRLLHGLSQRPDQRNALIDRLAELGEKWAEQTHRVQLDTALRWELLPLAALAQQLHDFGRPSTAVSIINWVCTPFRHFGDYAGARTQMERAVKIGEAHFESGHPALAASYSNLALILQDLGDYAGARTQMQRATKITEDHFEPGHPTLATSYSNLALILQDFGDYAGARTQMQRAIKIDKAHFEPGHPTLATRYSNLALILGDLGDYAGARTQMQRAIKIDEAHFESGHPTLATRYSNLALILQGLGDYPEARNQMERAIKIAEDHFEPEHPTLATNYSNLAAILQKLGDYAGARTQMQRAIKIDEAHFEPRHPILAVRYNNYAHLLLQIGDQPEACKNWRLSLQILQTHFDNQHPHVQSLLISLKQAGCQ